MSLNILTSSSKLLPITNLDYINDLARWSKCNLFYLCKYTNKLYASMVEPYSIHEFDIPFEVQTDLAFLSTFDSEIIEKNNQFFIPEKYPSFLIPIYYWDMYINNEIYPYHDTDLNMMILLDRGTGMPIDNLATYSSDRVGGIIGLINQVRSFWNRDCSLGQPYTITGLENNPVIREAYDTKTVGGGFFLKLSTPIKEYGLYFFKTMFPLNKGDTLSLTIRDDLINNRLFSVTYHPVRKKRIPLQFDTTFIDRIHCMYINLL